MFRVTSIDDAVWSIFNRTGHSGGLEVSRARKRKKLATQNDKQDATDEQKKFIRVLLKELVGAALQEDALQQLGKRRASSIINQLQDVQAKLCTIEELDMSRGKGLDAKSAAERRRAWLLALALWRW
jgi:hypothetical protein